MIHMSLTPEIIERGNKLEERWWRERGTRRFELELEKFCAEVWKPWITQRGWTLIDLTQPKTAEFQIPDVLNKIRPYVKGDKALQIIEVELKMFCKSVMFPVDLILMLDGNVYLADYKFKTTTGDHIWEYKNAYDKYYKLKEEAGVPFLLLYWFKGARYIHTVQNPSKYKIVGEPSSEKNCYIIHSDCINVEENPLYMPKIPEKIEVFRLNMEQLSKILASYPPEIPVRKRGRASKLDVALFYDILELRKSGNSYRQIAKTLNISLGMVQRALKKSQSKQA